MLARIALLSVFVLPSLLSILAEETAGPQLSLIQIQKILEGKKFVDLTHAFAPGIPHWPGFPDEKRETIY